MSLLVLNVGSWHRQGCSRRMCCDEKDSNSVPGPSAAQDRLGGCPAPACVTPTSSLRHLGHMQIKTGVGQKRCQLEHFESIAGNFCMPIKSGLVFDDLSTPL